MRRNAALDEAHVIDPADPYPLPDASADLWVCAMTPNKWGYIGLGARAVPNALHVGFLKKLQPHRQAQDVFPTTYLMNTRRDLERWFPADQWELAAYTINTEPAYFGASKLAWGAALTLLNRAPRPLGATWLIFARRK